MLIESDLEVATKYISINIDNYSCYSFELAKIILLACSEVEIIFKLLCKEIKPDFKESNPIIETYTSIILERFSKLPTCNLYITHNGQVIKPFDGWSSEKGSSPKWWKEYQILKHNRHQNFSNANLENALNSVAGLIILNLYLFRLISKESYANPSPYPKIFHSEYFSPYLLARAEKGLPGFISG